MYGMTVGDVAKAADGEIFYADAGNLSEEVKGIVIDSRLVKAGDIFVATRGERVDGHSFISGAFASGTIAVICEEVPENAEGICIKVEDSFEALKKIAAFYRSGLSIPIVGITGSVGKTSTKEFVASVLSQHYSVLKTDGNFNNEVGLPLTLFRIGKEHQAAVLEMGINTFGEMHRLSEIARPNMVVMTNIGECHLEFLGDRDGVLRAKSEIFDFMDPEGDVFVNADDDKLATVESVHGKKTVKFGFDDRYDVWGEVLENNGLEGSSILIHTEKGDIEAQVKLPGLHMATNALAAAAVGLKMGLSFDEIKKGIAAVLPVDGRSHLIDTGKLRIIDDCYNANPVSVKAALDLLAVSGGRRVAILGDMFELGEDELKMHREVGEYAVKSGIDLLLCAGELSKAMYSGACESPEKIPVSHFDTRDELIASLKEYIKEGDTVLVKASHGMEFPEIVSILNAI